MAKRSRRGRGEGTIYQEADGSWVGQVSYGKTSAGKRRRKKVRGATKAEVLAKLRRLPGSAPAGEPCKLTLAEHLDRWLSNHVKLKGSPTTHVRYAQIIEHQITPHLGGLSLVKLSALDVEDLYATLARQGVSADGRHKAALVLGAALKHAVRLGLIPSSPASLVPMPKVTRREMQVLTPEQVKAFLAAARRSRHFALFVLAVSSGMRRGELLGLEWPDIDFEAGTVTVRRSLVAQGGNFVLKEPKSRVGRRTIALPLFCLDSLAEHRKQALARGQLDRPVFCSRKGSYLTGSNLLQCSFQPVLKRAGLPKIRFHDLRHSHATALIASGLSIKAVSARLGHSDVALTLRIYTHVLPGDDNRLAAEVQRLYG